MKTRKFNLRTYVFHSDYKKKINAQQTAMNFRKAHIGARVVYSRGMWQVWVHKKSWMK